MRVELLRSSIKGLFNLAGYEISRKDRYRRKDVSGAGRVCWPPHDGTAKTFFEIDEEFHSLYALAQARTQMTATDNPLRRQRHYTLNYLLRSADLSTGDVCEVGCWRGLSTYQIAYHIETTQKQAVFHVFDSFQGLSEITSVDTAVGASQDRESVRRHFACSLETVEENLSEFDFIRYYQGWIPDRFHEVEDRGFAFVHIDVDLYKPTYDSFRFFYPRLVKQGVMVFDDYGSTFFPGAKRAIDHCVAAIQTPLFVPLPSGQAFLIKRP